MAAGATGTGAREAPQACGDAKQGKIWANLPCQTLATSTRLPARFRCQFGHAVGSYQFRHGLLAILVFSLTLREAVKQTARRTIPSSRAQSPFLLSDGDSPHALINRALLSSCPSLPALLTVVYRLLNTLYK